MKFFAIFLTLLMISPLASAGETERFRCRGVERRGRINFYTTVKSLKGHLQIKYTDSYYGDDGNPTPEIDKPYGRSQNGPYLIFTAPGATDKVILTLDTESRPDRMPGGQEWIGYSQVLDAELKIGNAVPVKLVCELLLF